MPLSKAAIRAFAKLLAAGESDAVSFLVAGLLENVLQERKVKGGEIAAARHSSFLPTRLLRASTFTIPLPAVNVVAVDCMVCTFVRAPPVRRSQPAVHRAVVLESYRYRSYQCLDR
jgi:hypothetical protein